MNGGTVAQMTGNAMELNNNAGPVEAFEKIRSPSRMSMSSASSCHSDSSEDGDGMGTEEVERNEGDTVGEILMKLVCRDALRGRRSGLNLVRLNGSC